MADEEEVIRSGLQEILDMVPPELGDDDVIPADIQDRMKAITQRLIDALG